MLRVHGLGRHGTAAVLCSKVWARCGPQSYSLFLLLFLPSPHSLSQPVIVASVLSPPHRPSQRGPGTGGPSSGPIRGSKPLFSPREQPLHLPRPSPLHGEGEAAGTPQLCLAVGHVDRAPGVWARLRGPTASSAWERSPLSLFSSPSALLWRLCRGPREGLGKRPRAAFFAGGGI